MSDVSAQPAISAVILAGGLSRRMGGDDKGRLKLNGKPLIGHVLERIQDQVDECLINANRNQQDYANLGLPVLADLQADFQGPLMGFASGLQQAKHEWVLFVPCDMPLLPPDLVSRLWQAAAGQNRSLAVAHDGQRMQPVVVLMQRTLLPSLQQALAQSKRKVQLWLQEQQPAVADFSDCPGAFINLNRPDELAALQD